MMPVEPFVGEGDSLRYRSCDFCYETVVEDIWAGKWDEAEWRRFYLLPDGCSLCGDCAGRMSKDELCGWTLPQS